MQAHYKMQQETEALIIKGDQFMEREQYQNQIKDLLQAVETLLKSNKAMGEKLDKATVLDELEKNSGKQFDPDLSKVFIGMINSGVVK